VRARGEDAVKPYGMGRESDPTKVQGVSRYPAWQSQGVGRQLVSALEANARRLGFLSVRAGTRRRLPGNTVFYERLGYRVVAVEPYPPGTDDHTVWLEKLL
jgi:GNAT superfamily N-acetyltransferase